MYALYAESISLEIQEMYEKFDTDMAYLNQMLVGDALNDARNIFLEKGEEKQSGGLIGIIKSMLRGIRDLLSSAGKKLKSLLFGTSVRPDKKNEKYVLDRDPNMLTKLVNGDIKNSTEMLRKASRGELSVDEAKRFVQKQNGSLDAVKSIATTVVGAFGMLVANKHYMDKWKAQADDALTSIEASTGSNFSSKVANQYDPTNKTNAAKEAVSIISQHLQSTQKRGIDAILAPLQNLYQKNYLTNKILSDAEKTTTKKGRIELGREHSRKISEERSFQKKIKKGKKNRDRAEAFLKRAAKQKYAETQNTKRTLRDSYADTKNIYVDGDTQK